MNVLVWSVIVDPGGLLGLEANASDSSTPVVETDSGWFAQTNLIGVPAGIPAPHSFGAAARLCARRLSARHDLPAVCLQDRDGLVGL